MAAKYKSGWSPSNLERYNRFMSALVHGEDWTVGVKYFAIYWLKFHGNEGQLYSPMFENCGELHAEGNLLKHLRLQMSAMHKEKVEAITIMQSASPCRKCSQKYASELRELTSGFRIRITIVFSSFYSIQRPYCLREGHLHVENIKDCYSQENKQGLRKLISAGFSVRCTNYDDWTNLRSALQLPPTYSRETYSYSTRKREDEALRTDLQEILKQH